MWGDPGEERVREDKRQKLKGRPENEERRWFDPPENLSDHAPVNYSAHLEELMKSVQEDEKQWPLVEQEQGDGQAGVMEV